MEQTAQNRLEAYIKLVEQALEKYSITGNLGGLQREVGCAMDYSLKAGGKRLRPVMTLEFCRICGGEPEKALPAACAVEMIHTFSLIHDDLPCMDDDDMRRGKPSCHKKFGEATALLAGDALSIQAFEVIASAEELDPLTRVKLVKELACAAGAQKGMIGGQMMDMGIESAKSGVDRQTLSEMHGLKTGRLIQAACNMGCICAGADDESLVNAGKYACYLGMAFQIIDDILDVVGDEEKLGKPIGSDAEQEKNTFVTVCGLEEAKKTAKEYTDKAMSVLDRFNDSGFLKELTARLLERDH